MSVVNALSEEVTIQVHKDGKIYQQEYSEGKPKYSVKEVGKTDKTGTSVTFKPDAKIFETVEFNTKTVLTKMRQHAYLNGGLHFKFADLREGKKYHYNFHFEGGIRSYIRHLNQSLKVIQDEIFYVTDLVDDVNVEVALQYSDDLQSRELFFGNNVLNRDGGTHQTLSLIHI